MTATGIEIPLNLVKPSAPYEATVIENRCLTPGSSEDVRHIVLSLGESGLRYLEGQSVGVIPPGLDEAGKPLRLRLYSVASARGGDDDTGTTVSLCVKRTIYENERGEIVRGVCSNYLNDRVAGDRVKICGPIGKHFLLPPDPEQPIVMFATGTGIAPFRAFLRQRSILKHRGAAILIFGVRTSNELLYLEELQALLKEPGDRLALAISREQKNAEGGRMYVGDRLHDLGDDVLRLLSGGAFTIYQCGLKGMEAGVEAAFSRLLSQEGLDFSALKPEWVRAKRWLVDTY
ncbi:MAG: ferredoxin--NADP(+) reductase [Candidatus Sericytochromatia bacterium]|nr:ferredoxin--NADP(+) reductase [Candidatus Sericytochromatia bacterium]